MVIFLIFVHKNVYRIRFQKIKIRPLKCFEKKAFVSPLLMRKRLFGGVKWFLKPYFPLIRGMFVFRSGSTFFSLDACLSPMCCPLCRRSRLQGGRQSFIQRGRQSLPDKLGLCLSLADKSAANNSASSLVDCPTEQYLYLDFHLCSMTKLKEHSREICYLFLQLLPP